MGKYKNLSITQKMQYCAIFKKNVCPLVKFNNLVIL